MILSGELAPGSPLLQAEMARKLGVSRTPLREAFRLLQEEGLIAASPDKRARVRAVDASDLDSTYGARIVLESLGVSVTIRQATDSDVDELRAALTSMRRMSDAGEREAWYAAHREFHRLATQAVAPDLARQMASLRERGELYVRLDRVGHTGASTRADAEHEALLTAFSQRDEQAAVRKVARHLARTSLSIMSEIAPEREPVATRAALRLVTHDDPAD
jgi:DNA-binding GntR family transcriptional regulator